jgi:CBS-domain-containing membrane protein
MRAREVMSTPVVTVPPEAALKDVAKLMATHNVSGVPVLDQVGRLVGIVSESDVLTKLEYGEQGRGLLGLLDQLAHGAGADRKLHAHTAADLMTTRVISAGPETSFRELLHLMTIHDVNRLPIVEGGRVIGIVTRADILRIMTRPDAAITKDARWRLLHDLWIDTEALTITTRGGIVTISGEVGTRSEAELVKHWVAVMEGVVDVDARALQYRIDDRHITPETGQPRDFHGRSPLGPR